jgi:hypothetical protein
MAVIYVVDVPEFVPIVEAARKKPNCTVTEAKKGYYKITTTGAVTFNRREMQMKPALWFGMFTGGLNGEITSFNRDEVTVIGTNQPL